MRSRRVMPAIVLVGLVAVAAATDAWRSARVAVDSGERDDSAGFESYPIEPFTASDVDGQPVGTPTWAGRVVVINFWATWCAPCRREIPALSALQDAWGDRILVLGILDDTVSDDFARAFAKSTGLTYPIVRTSFELERRFPAIAVLPMTFVVDQQGRLVHMYAGEIDPVRVDRAIGNLLGGI